ncbi:AIPR family protein [Pseudoalteromonas sp. Of11M-6]|uniref:AIPR family protein n=1 Tax=Pseudoalteromonas sp. Of11M-6 TaxID=2917754 RepID=UPI001EF6D815|nr:AIPR family protein [Pseudoalteromonas sp. Of11M-6]MCG7556325.1 AIPR family protein [Pseudoalteromonas sp. Of11M-6]
MTQKVLSNKIILGILEEFKANYEFGESSESKLFERLVNYVTLSKYDPEAFSDVTTFDFVDVDRKSTFGIDAFALFINDNLISNKEDIIEHRKTKRMDVRLVFIQTKRSTSFDSGEFLKFTAAVKNFLSDSPLISLSEDLLECKNLVEELFSADNARLFAKKKPKCEMYFAISGSNSEEKDYKPIFLQEERALKALAPEFEAFSIRLVNSDYIIDSYSELENKYTVSINFEKGIPCHPIKDVEQSYIGYLPISEFLKLITGSDGNIRKNIFYENVRDFQGEENAVNSEMAETLKDQQKIDQFLILNNGVTVVAKEFSNIRSNEYEICDYYIVNGCQTSNVLFQHSDLIANSSSLFVPIKIVHTTNNSVISSIIRSTNRQTPVPDEAFVSLEKFHKRLQEYYQRFSQNCFQSLYYERRSKEFNGSLEQIERPRIVNLHGLIRSFTSIILNEPQLAMSQNPTVILKEHRSKLFQDDHVYAPYFLSSLLLYLFYVYSEEGKISKKYVISRYWVCWVARTLLTKSLNIGHLNSAKVDKNCETIIESLSDESFSISIFRKSIHVFEEAKKKHRDEHGRQYNKQLIRLKSFRDCVKTVLVGETS